MEAVLRLITTQLGTDNSELSTSLSGGEGGHSKSRSLKLLTLLQRGPAPS